MTIPDLSAAPIDEAPEPMEPVHFNGGHGHLVMMSAYPDATPCVINVDHVSCLTKATLRPDKVVDLRAPKIPDMTQVHLGESLTVAVYGTVPEVAAILFADA